MKNPRGLLISVGWVFLFLYILIMGMGFGINFFNRQGPSQSNRTVIYPTSPPIVPATSSPQFRLQPPFSTTATIDIGLVTPSAGLTKGITSTQITNINNYTPPDQDDLQRLILELVNSERSQFGLMPVEWDDFSARVGQVHAEEMSKNQYMSHWNLLGYGPDLRYALDGGVDVVQENVFQYRLQYDDGSPVPIDDWNTVIQEAHAAWMNSPGHRDNILNPAHTHMGIGIAYDSTSGYLSLVQEFTNHYIELDPFSPKVGHQDPINLSGWVLTGVDNIIVNIAYEPFPVPLTIEELKITDTYISPAQNVDIADAIFSDDGYFSISASLEKPGTSGFYHVRIWIDQSDVEIQALDVVLQKGN